MSQHLSPRSHIYLVGEPTGQLAILVRQELGKEAVNALVDNIVASMGGHSPYKRACEAVLELEKARENLFTLFVDNDIRWQGYLDALAEPMYFLSPQEVHAYARATL